MQQSSDVEPYESRRQKRADLVNAFSRSAWQPSAQPQVGPRVVAGGVALIVVAGAAFGIGALTTYQHRQAAAADRQRRLALSGQDGTANSSLQRDGAPASGPGGAPNPVIPTPGAPQGGNALARPVAPVGPGTAGQGGPAAKTAPNVSGTPTVTTPLRTLVSPALPGLPGTARTPGRTRTAAKGESATKGRTKGTAGTPTPGGTVAAAHASKPRDLAAIAAQQGGETAPWIVGEPSQAPVPGASPAGAPKNGSKARRVASPQPGRAPARSAGGGQPSGGHSAYQPIQAEAFDRKSKWLGTENTDDAGGGQNLAWVGDGDWALYKGVDFGSTGATQFYGRVASGAQNGISGMVEVRLDDPASAPVGSFSVANTGGWQSWRTVPANMSRVTGVHDVYLTFASGQSADFVNMNWFDFGF